jgi:hypothetical protein
MATDRRFEVSINLVVKENKADGEHAFFDSVVTYHDVTYDVLLVLEKAMLDAVNAMNDAGVVAALSMGMGDKLASFGLMQDKVAALSAK